MPQPEASRGLSSVDRPRQKRADIQGLRALAVLLVIGYHLGAPRLHGGFVGVDVFFAISGFVIVTLLLREHDEDGRISVLSFYARRARRILPAATLVALATMVATYIWLGYLAGNRVAGVARWAAVFMANFHFYWAGTSYFNASDPVSPLLHYWSLGVEEQFYLVVPVLALLAGRLARRSSKFEARSLMVVVVGIMTLASLYLSISRSASSPTFAYFLPYTRVWELGAGALLALLAPRLRLATGLALPLSWLGLGSIAVAATTFGPSTTYPGSAALLPVLGTVAVITAGSAAGRLSANHLLGLRPVTWFGDRSFSLYLVGFPIVTIASESDARRLSHRDQLVLLIATVAIAAASYRLVEQPFLNAPSLKASRRASLGLGAVLVALGLIVPTVAIGMHGDPSGSWRAPARPTSLAALSVQLSTAVTDQRLPARVEPPLSQVATATTTFVDPALDPACLLPRGSVVPPTCVSGAKSSARHAVLVGDSYAGMWSAAASVVAKQHGLALTTMAKMACSPWTTAGDLSQGDSSCPQWRGQLASRIAALHPSLVIIAVSRGDLRVPEVKRDTANALGLAAFARGLVANGATVVVLGPTPTYSVGWAATPPPDCLAQHATALQHCMLDRSEVEHVNAGFAASLREGAQAAGAHFQPVLDLTCTTGACPVVVGQRLVYYNKSHLTASYASYIGPALNELLNPLLGR